MATGHQTPRPVPTAEKPVAANMRPLDALVTSVMVARLRPRAPAEVGPLFATALEQPIPAPAEGWAFRVEGIRINALGAPVSKPGGRPLPVLRAGPLSADKGRILRPASKLDRANPEPTRVQAKTAVSSSDAKTALAPRPLVQTKVGSAKPPGAPRTLLALLP